MALADVLSAMRVLILDDDPPQGSFAERRTALAGRFKALSDSEVDDLARIPPKRLAVYTRVIFAGERAMFSWTYPASTAVIIHLLRKGSDDRPDNAILFDIVRDLHRVAPWRSSSTRELAGNFETYITTHRTDLCCAWPGLPDLVRFERCDLEVFYAADDEGHRLDLSRAAEWSVERLMQTVVSVPRYVRLASFDYDLLALRTSLGPDQQVPAELPDPAPLHAACGRRAVDLMPVWQRLAFPEFRTLTEIKPQDPIALGDVATIYLAMHDSGAFPNEQAAFQSFFAWLVDLARNGVLIAAPTSA